MESVLDAPVAVAEVGGSHGLMVAVWSGHGRCGVAMESVLDAPVAVAEVGGSHGPMVAVWSGHGVSARCSCSCR
ncbi:hypothetical protein RRG08_063964 [Elysia crispata]|uniref:Uncharacterized protein n=1 Tax=Elysia crispata TaxID=231223 RepID=A0AAE0YEI0_9GAST|nr:hypothetical protein RRG08_063964 [Elysia crispata]